MLDLPPVGASFGVAAQVARPGAATRISISRKIKREGAPRGGRSPTIHRRLLAYPRSGRMGLDQAPALMLYV